ncbi:MULTISPECIES: glucose 1-dehydrogenase [Acidithiobacillus]|jgi:glucose 1-dehydrogenase|uniref:Glucose 1-dehydrogenase n=4 Tax=Acidithiobacillus caldus TaxID=33059 RepID=F9ZN46_ACICS|nr:MULTISPECIES: glucose 1-dehydrogenase [Acidithiobacillus]AEK58089.1 glucose 1-dehydrogenase [Acidithiobacillus caldus SM-1]AIA55079.1 3-oxoacyl-(acyl-carrier protein) reductase [Acidithiobacillus caldus ATCC 51756]AUW32736.1 glucose 1-dehydrogenase [Acidithiobacillus caldus]MBU2730301.1 glucose 1-dehydrogenase [Acidithiobacillus caldus]MBU2734374.1 glucose 1-dehydrogenase [Acidithiobacillus caldus ATCC 51756]
MLNIDLHGRVALVTGASGGLGRAIATTLAAAGARVAVHYGKDAKGAAGVVADIRQQGGEAEAFGADVADANAVADLVGAAHRHFGALDILVNNAGMDGPRQLVGADKPDAWQKVIAVDLLGPYYCARAAVSLMEQARRGVIINVTSVHEFIPWEGYSAYASAKAGLSMFTKTLAQETADRGIRVVAIAPGAIQTPINASVWGNPDSLKDLDQKIAMGRLGRPEEVAQVIAFLASDLASYITGTTLAVDGGMLIYPDFRHGG